MAKEKRKLTTGEKSRIVASLMTATSHYERMRGDILNENNLFLNSPSISQKTVANGYRREAKETRVLATLILNDEVQL